MGGAFYLVATLNNNGRTEITGVQTQATFLGPNGNVLETQTRPVQAMSNGPNSTAEDLTKAPIKPDSSRIVRIYFDHYPADWNRQVPDLKVTAVTGTTP